MSSMALTSLLLLGSAEFAIASGRFKPNLETIHEEEPTNNRTLNENLATKTQNLELQATEKARIANLQNQPFTPTMIAARANRAEVTVKNADFKIAGGTDTILVNNSLSKNDSINFNQEIARTDATTKLPTQEEINAISLARNPKRTKQNNAKSVRKVYSKPAANPISAIEATPVENQEIIPTDATPQLSETAKIKIQSDLTSLNNNLTLYDLLTRYKKDELQQPNNTNNSDLKNTIEVINNDYKKSAELDRALGAFIKKSMTPEQAKNYEIKETISTTNHANRIISISDIRNPQLTITEEYDNNNVPIPGSKIIKTSNFVISKTLDNSIVTTVTETRQAYDKRIQDKNGELKPTIDIDPSSGNKTVKTYNESGQIASYIVYDSQGKTIRSYIISNPQESFDNEGYFVIKSQNENGQNVKRINPTTQEYTSTFIDNKGGTTTMSYKADDTRILGSTKQTFADGSTNHLVWNTKTQKYYSVTVSAIENQEREKINNIINNQQLSEIQKIKNLQFNKNKVPNNHDLQKLYDEAITPLKSQGAMPAQSHDAIPAQSPKSPEYYSIQESLASLLSYGIDAARPMKKSLISLATGIKDTATLTASTIRTTVMDIFNKLAPQTPRDVQTKAADAIATEKPTDKNNIDEVRAWIAKSTQKIYDIIFGKQKSAIAKDNLPKKSATVSVDQIRTNKKNTMTVIDESILEINNADSIKDGITRYYGNNNNSLVAVAQDGTIVYSTDSKSMDNIIKRIKEKNTNVVYLTENAEKTIRNNPEITQNNNKISYKSTINFNAIQPIEIDINTWEITPPASINDLSPLNLYTEEETKAQTANPGASTTGAAVNN